MTLSGKLRPGDVVLQPLPYDQPPRPVEVTSVEPDTMTWYGHRIPVTRVLGRVDGRLFAVVTLAGFQWERVERRRLAVV